MTDNAPLKKVNGLTSRVILSQFAIIDKTMHSGLKGHLAAQYPI
jgi:hypothetical protein